MQGTTLRGTRRSSKISSGENWANIWFEKLARFHRVYQPQHWQFDEKPVVEFLQSKLKAGVPAWKRLRIVEGLIGYRNRVRQSKTPQLEWMRTKLQTIALREQNRDDDEPIEEVVGKIDPNDPDIIRQMQRTMRLERKRPNTGRQRRRCIDPCHIAHVSP